MTSKLLDFNLIEHRAGPTNLILGRPHIATCRNLAGRTLNSFKAYFMPDLHPWTVGVAQFEACRKRFFCPKIRVNMMNFTAPDRASPNMLDIYDSWSGCLWHDTLDSQWERASVTYHILRAFTAEIWHHPYYFLYLVFYCETEHTAGVLADNINYSQSFFLLQSHLISSWVSVRSHVTVKSFLHSSSVWSCGPFKSSNVLVQRIIRQKIGWNCLHVCGFKIG